MAEPEQVLVPALVGLNVSDAHALAMSAGVAVVGEDPDATLPTTGVVIDQHPLAGIRVPAGDPVTVRLRADPGGGDGDDGDDGGGGGGGGGSAPVPDPPRPLDAAGAK
jgi:hypothetical protein